VPKSADGVRLEKLFIFSAVFAQVVQTAFMVFMAVQQYGSNPNLSSFYGWAASAILGPVAVVVLLYVSRRKKSLTRRGIFELFSVATAIFMLSIAVSSLESWVSPWMFTALDDTSTLFLYTILPVALTFILTLAAALYLRRSKDW